MAPQIFRTELPRGVYRWTKADPEDHWARVHVRAGEWTDLSKADYDSQKIEPTFWALQEEDSWLEDAAGLSGGGM